MFQELFAVARHTPLNIITTPNGERLSVIVIPKPSGDASDNPALAKPLSFVGTPEELDKEFPEQLRLYSEKVNDLRSKFELPIEALDAAAAKGAKKKTKAAPAAPKAKPARTNGKKAKSKIQLPGQSAAAPKNPVKAAPPKPEKPECIADLKEMYAKYGNELTRRGFVKRSKTGRRYEKLWKNYEEFFDEAIPVADRLKWKVRGLAGAEVTELQAAPKTGQKLKVGDATWVVLALDGQNVVAKLVT